MSKRCLLLFILFASLSSFAQKENVSGSDFPTLPVFSNKSAETRNERRTGNEPRPGDKYALVIIDMQPQFVTRGGNDKVPANEKKVEEIIGNQKKLIEFAKSQKIPIVVIEYKRFGPTNLELLKALSDYDDVKKIEKNTDGFFDTMNSSKKEVSEYLKEKEIGNLIITGANGGACVEQSILGSLENNYNVIAYSKGIADFNYKEFIFPYDNHYEGLAYDCLDCKFKEIDDYETLTLAVTTGVVVEENSAKVNNSDRGIIKDLPVVREPKIETAAPVSAQ